MTGSVKVAQNTLNVLVLVRIQTGQLQFFKEKLPFCFQSDETIYS